MNANQIGRLRQKILYTDRDARAAHSVSGRARFPRERANTAHFREGSVVIATASGEDFFSRVKKLRGQLTFSEKLFILGKVSCRYSSAGRAAHS